MITWVPEEKIWEEGNLVAEESMAGSGYSRRWTASEKIDGLYALVTVGFYCNDRRGAYGSDDPDVVGLDATVPAEKRYCIGQHIEFMLCRNPEDPGGTEEWCDYRYADSWFSRAEKFTDEQMKALLENFKTEWIYWDGNLSNDLDTQSAWAEPSRPEDWDGLILTEELKDWVFLYELFRDEVCQECKLDADAHTVGPGPFGHRHAWCRIADPKFALDVLRARIDQADTTLYANGFSDESLRAEQFEAALYALDEDGLLTERIEFIVGSRNRANSGDGEDTRAEARITLDTNLDAVQQQISKKEA